MSFVLDLNQKAEHELDHYLSGNGVRNLLAIQLMGVLRDLEVHELLQYEFPHTFGNPPRWGPLYFREVGHFWSGGKLFAVFTVIAAQPREIARVMAVRPTLRDAVRQAKQRL